MSGEDFYSLLEVTQTCSATELKQSYKKLARKYHPDNKETGDENLFKKLGEAYSVLSDEQKRAYYDRIGHEGYLQGGSRGPSYAGGDIFNDLQDVFDSFFGGNFSTGSSRRTRKTRERGSDLQVILELDFLDGVFGGPKNVSVNHLVNCKACTGSGADPSAGLKTCGTCQGSGEIKRVTQSFLGVITQVSTCPTCNGLGSIIPVPCKVCAGKGQTRESAELEVKIPRGVEDGSRLVWSQKGNEGRNGGPAGDLYILLKIKPHPKFQRDRLDIYEELNVSVWQAIFGDNLEIETVHGNQSVDLKPGLQSATVITLPNQGVRLENGQSGAHHLKVNVQIPHKKDLPKNVADLIKEEVFGKADKQTVGSFTDFFKRGKGKE
jgi:molecular chaperone DnaJ